MYPKILLRCTNVTKVTQKQNIVKISANSSRFKCKSLKKYIARVHKRNADAPENELIDEYIAWAEDERTALAKLDTAAPKFAAIKNAYESYQQKSTRIAQRSKNLAYTLSIHTKQIVQNLINKRAHVRFESKAQICTFRTAHQAIMLTYDSGADGNYMSKDDRKRQVCQFYANPHNL